MPKRENISMSVIRRLPRYYRFLKLLREKGVTRISSTELSAKLGLTASQIRQDQPDLPQLSLVSRRKNNPLFHSDSSRLFV